jgi:hypothetical protein
MWELDNNTGNKVVLISSGQNRTVNIGDRKGSVFTRFCYNEKDYYIKVELKKYYTNKLTSFYQEGEGEKLEAVLINAFSNKTDQLVSCDLVDLLKPQFIEIRRISEILTEKLDIKTKGKKLNPIKKNKKALDFSKRFDIHEQNGILLNKE